MTKHEDYYNYIKGRIRNLIAIGIMAIGVIIIAITLLLTLVLLVGGEYTYGTETYQVEVHTPVDPNWPNSGYYCTYEEATRPKTMVGYEYLWHNLIDFFHNLPLLEQFTVYTFFIGIIILLFGIFVWNQKFENRKNRREKREEHKQRWKHCNHETATLEISTSLVSPNDADHKGIGTFACNHCEKVLTVTDVTIITDDKLNMKW